MSKPIVLIDCDGVLSDFVAWYCSIATSVTGSPYDPREVTQWDVATSLGLLRPEQERVEELVRQPGRVAAMQPLPGAVEGVALLREVAEVHP